jgi:hypothetical protein
MESTIKEIASVLRSTEPMAAQFAQRVQDRVGQPVSHDEILAAMKKISSKSLSLEKVIAKVQEEQKRVRRRASRRRTPSRKAQQPSVSTNSAAGASPLAPSQGPKTILGRLEVVLEDNWDRAETEGLSPSRMSIQDFISAVYRYTDRREASRQRILQAARQLDRDNVLLTPALVADVVHKLFEGRP